MEKLLSDPLFIFLTLALIASIGYNIWQIIERNKAWTQVMAETNLRLEEHKEKKNRDKTLSGVYRHRQLVLADSAQSVYRNGKRTSSMLTNATTNLHVALAQPQTNKLTLHRTNNVKKSLPVGDEEFEGRFNISCEPDGFAQAFLAQESLRQKLLQIKPGGQIEIKENEVVYDQTDRVLNPERILTLLDMACSVADAVDAFHA